MHSSYTSCKLDEHINANAGVRAIISVFPRSEAVSNLPFRVVLLERERASQLYSKKHEFRGIFSFLEETELRMHQQRKAESKTLYNATCTALTL